MKTLKDAIALIMAEPPEPHYPSYYADLLREADVPDKDDGNCSEIPNSSDTISRQDAIDVLSEAGLINYAATGDGNGMIQAVNVIKGLPSAQPEIIRCSQCKYAEVADKGDAQDGYTCQFHRGSIWFSGSFCSWAERRTRNEQTN